MTATLSVGVPTYGRPDRLRACLAAIAGDLPALRPDWRVELLVADGRAPEAEAVVTECGAAFDDVRYLPAPVGVSPARNLLARNASGEYLVYVDDDVRPLPGSVAALVRDARPDAIVAARVANLGHFGDESNLGRIGRDGFGYPVPPGREPDYVISAFVVVPRAVYTTVPWDDRFTVPHLDDVVWGLRVKAAGYGLAMSEARGDHGPRKPGQRPDLVGLQPYVALLRWGSARAWAHCALKSVWSVKPDPRAMAAAFGGTLRAAAMYRDDRKRAA